jgi:hypothetical protein
MVRLMIAGFYSGYIYSNEKNIRRKKHLGYFSNSPCLPPTTTTGPDQVANPVTKINRSLRSDSYVRMQHFVRQSTYVPFRRFWGDVRR